VIFHFWLFFVHQLWFNYKVLLIHLYQLRIWIMNILLFFLYLHLFMNAWINSMVSSCFFILFLFHFMVINLIKMLPDMLGLVSQLYQINLQFNIIFLHIIPSLFIHTFSRKLNYSFDPKIVKKLSKFSHFHFKKKINQKKQNPKVQFSC
jgi:hypothetical protein